jgi:hypothetical protein
VSFTRRTLLASLGLTLPVAAAEAATRRHKVKHVASHHTASHASHQTASHQTASHHNAGHQTAHAARMTRTRRSAPRAEG